jgi:hypothetical protein
MKPAGRRQKKILRPAASLLLFLVCCSVPTDGNAADTILVGNFSGAADLTGLPEGWEPLQFKNIPAHTNYRLVRDQGVTVLEADSRASSSGLIRKISVNPHEYPILSWKWKVAGVYAKGDVTKKAGDDYPARIYITFAYDAAKVNLWEQVKFNAVKLLYGEYPPGSAINYIWASKAPAKLITPNPYTDRVMMIAVESGPARLHQWISEKRDIAGDYRAAFGADPPAISGIAVMTDSDNTGESGKAWYGDIVLEGRH